MRVRELVETLSRTAPVFVVLALVASTIAPVAQEYVSLPDGVCSPMMTVGF